MRIEVDFPVELVEAVAQRAAELLRADVAPAASSSPYVNVDQAAEYLCCDRQRIYDLLSARRLTKLKDGSRVLLLREELDRHVAQALPSTPRARMAAGVKP